MKTIAEILLEYAKMEQQQKIKIVFTDAYIQGIYLLNSMDINIVMRTDLGTYLIPSTYVYDLLNTKGYRYNGISWIEAIPETKNQLKLERF
jgi:hypothetical protein